MINFKSTPFFKILLPYLMGVFCVFKIGEVQNQHVVFLGVFIIWLITFFVQFYSEHKGRFKKWAYIFSTNLFLITLAFESCFLYNAKNNSNHYSHYVASEPQSFIATIIDIPVVTEKSIKLSVEVNSIESFKTWHYSQGSTIIYLKNDSTINLLLGNTVFINGKFGFVNEPKNPEEFDYKTFLANRNIFHTVYVNPKSIYIISNQSNNSNIIQFGSKIKEHIVELFRNSNLSQEAFSICSALLVGYDDEIDNDVMQSFSHSGTLHILSVSGMHTGVLYGVLIFVFSLIDKYDKHKKTKFLFVMFFLLLFVFITGFSPSVLRAAIMLSLVLFGKTFYKQGNSYNTLLLSAFVLLLFNPYLIKDVGFLLSYFAVFGIIYFYPILSKTYVFENKILQNAWSGVLMSVSATLFTLPISLYFFHQFPIWFVLANLIIIPISMILMGAAFVFLLFYKITIINQLLVFIINSLTSAMLWCAQLTDNPKYGFIDFVTFSKSDFFFMSLLILLFFVVITAKQYKQVLAFCFVIVAWLLSSIYINFQDVHKNQLLVFHIKHKSVFALRVGQSIYADFSEVNNKEFQRQVKPYLLTISDLKIFPTKCNFFKTASSSVLLANESSVMALDLNPSYIIVSNDLPLELTTNYKTKPLIIADCSNSYKFVKQLKKQCAFLDLPFYSVNENGALQINL